MIPSAKSTVLMGIIREKVRPDSVIYTDSLNAYDVLDVSEFHHQRINHSEQFVEAGKVHINGIEDFWNQAKRHCAGTTASPKQISTCSSKNVSGDSTTARQPSS